MTDTISQEQITNSMNLMAMMIIEELQKRTNKSQDELIVKFLNSTQGTMLYDDTTKLWTTSPSEIAENYLKMYE